MWLFETICPRCKLLNPRYWQSSVIPNELITNCLGVTCECGFEYIAINDQVKCIGCVGCIWTIRGHRVAVINQYEVIRMEEP